MAEQADHELTGGCQCGAIRCRLEGAPLRANICHCRMCQKAGAAPFMAFAAVPNERGFCAKCGTPLTFRGVKGATISVTILSLDDPNAVAPDSQLGVESQIHWLGGALSLPAIRTEEWLARAKIASVGNHQHPDRPN